MLAAFALPRTVEDHSDGISYGLKKGERGRRKRENKKEKRETQQGFGLRLGPRSTAPCQHVKPP